ncbi:unnamed protein product [Commensalibacter communis]|uniref:Uncharacterized protein n=1 Tax=Commensalibacter communis TaxID=2972786 RepID=A0A9W4TR47_9PROT|nr:hypothetical protein [Commensalibacter communis]CAI3941801.1 unnamed protein product [Commensalibacter communis]CAI3944829.1 unnamed protein product [Commensalibacter communis]CAI3959038.1 unnamed protein product [Commensalibacter communis]CAI3961015.1 unnamed protein product [Commensalibacter communis]
MGVSLKGPSIRDIILKKIPNFGKKLVLQVGYYEGASYPDGTSVGAVATIQEYGAVIQHPGGTKYIKDAVTSRMVNDPDTGKKKKVYTVGLRFVANNFVGETLVTGPHTIVIPARPFFRTALEKNAAKWRSDFAKIFKNTGFDVEKSMAALGSIIKQDIQQQIDNTYSPPNAASTIRAKKGETHPLIGLNKQLRNSIAWQVTQI